MKILLINPPISGHRVKDLFESEPLGLAYLAAFLEREGFDVDILDCFAMGVGQIYKAGGFLRRGLKDPEIKKLLAEKEPDIIGIHSNFTMHFPNAEEVAAIARTVFPDRPIVFGGAHATMACRAIIEKGIGDFVVRGEGEVTALELFNAIQKRLPVDGIPGIAYRDSSGKARVNADRPLLEDIDSLPAPARHKLDMDIYLRHSKESSPFSMNYPAASLITSRGCPNNCIFCSTKNMWKRRWRANSPEKVVGEIEHLVKHYGAREIIIQDDNFNADNRRAERILDLLIEKNLKITVHNSSGFYISSAGYDLMKKMKKAGFYRIIFPVESGNPETINFIRKAVDLDKVSGIVETANRVGLWTQTNFIIGFPYEKREDILTTVRYALGSGFDFASFLIAQPLAGAEMYDIFEKEGLLRSESMAGHSGFLKTRYDTKYLKAEEIQELRDWAAKQYIKNRSAAFFKPSYFFRYLLPKLNSWKKVRYFISIVLRIFLTPQKARI